MYPLRKRDICKIYGTERVLTGRESIYLEFQWFTK